MMRLLFLCMLLLLPAAAAVTDDNEGSADDALDDEDLDRKTVRGVVLGEPAPDSSVDKTTGSDESQNQFTLIVIVVAATVLALSIAAIVTIMLVRRQMHNREQGIYSVPTEQDQKGAI